MRFFVIAAAALTLSFAARAQVAGCTSDGDCKAGRICQAHACVEASGERCGRDVDCAGEDLCVERRCMSPGKARVFRAARGTSAPPLPAPPARALPAAPSGPAQTAAGASSGPAAATPAPPSSAALATPAAPAPTPVPTGPAVPAASTGASTSTAAVAPATPAAPAGSLDAAGPPLVIVQREADDGPGQLVYTGALTLGLARWSLRGSEYDLGFSANGEAGLRAAENLSLVLLGNVGYSVLSSDYSAVLGSLGAGIRLDRLIPGHVTVGGLASFGSISYGGPDAVQQNAGSTSFSGVAVVAQGSFPITHGFGIAAQTTFHTFSSGASLFTLTVGPSFGNQP